MSEPAQSPESGCRNGSRSGISQSRICEPDEGTCPCSSAFSISTCAQHNSTSPNNAHPHRTTSPVTVSDSRPNDNNGISNYSPKSPRASLLSPIPSFSLLKAAFNPSRVPSPLSLSPAAVPRPPLSPRVIANILSPTTPVTAPITLVTTATTPHSSLLFSTDMPQIHHPRPKHASSPSTSSPSSSNSAPQTTPHRPPSRSEKLLREVLMKDEHERNPLPHTAHPHASTHHSASRSPVRAHQRRHSHVPSSSDQHRAEDLVRGNFLFRSAMVTPRSPSPSPAPESRSRRHSQGPGHHRQPHHYDAQQQRLRHEDAAASSPYPYHHDAAAQSPPTLTRRSSVKSNPYHYRPSSPCSPVPPSRGGPSYAPSVASSARTHQSPTLSRRQVPHPLPLSPGPEPYHNEPQTMTPNEQVLRARLEQVLQSSNSRGSRSDDRYRRSEWNGEELSERTDSSDENYAYDENGRWVQGCAVGGKHGMSVMAVTPPSSGSNSARSMSREDMTTLPASASAYHHQRSRSRTEPAPVVPSAHAYPSPKRTHTTPASYHQRSQTRHGQYHHHGRSGTTPPLVSDGSPTPEEEDEDEDPEDVRLLTPPPTPPSQMAAYHHYSMGRHAKEYMPSPYKTTFDHRRSATAAPPLRYDHRRGRSGVPSAYSDDHDDADDDDDDDDEYDEEEESCSCSGGRCSGLCSRLSSTLHHRSQSMQHFGGIQSTGPQPHRPQFNVRRASARCRQMDGYVGFAEIEGLGVPPDSSDSSDEETKRRLIMAQRKREGGGVTEWVRWTKRRLLGGGEDEQQTQQRQQQHQQAHNAVVL